MPCSEDVCVQYRYYVLYRYNIQYGTDVINTTKYRVSSTVMYCTMAMNKLYITRLVFWIFILSRTFAIEEKERIKEIDNLVTNVDNKGNALDENPSSHILMFHPWNTKSWRIQQNALLEGLLARGHRVTGVFPRESSIKNERYTEIVVADG